MADAASRAKTAFLARRAEQEVAAAARATHPAAVSAHYRMSTRYLDLLSDEDAEVDDAEADPST